jgi:recombinational DNA repair protein (RecF pathway)
MKTKILLLEYKKRCVDCHKYISFKNFYDYQPRCIECFKIWYKQNKSEIEKRIKLQEELKRKKPKEREERDDEIDDLVTIFNKNKSRINKRLQGFYRYSFE